MSSRRKRRNKVKKRTSAQQAATPIKKATAKAATPQAAPAKAAPSKPAPSKPAPSKPAPSKPATTKLSAGGPAKKVTPEKQTVKNRTPRPQPAAETKPTVRPTPPVTTPTERPRPLPVAAAATQETSAAADTRRRRRPVGPDRWRSTVPRPRSPSRMSHPSSTRTPVVPRQRTGSPTSPAPSMRPKPSAPAPSAPVAAVPSAERVDAPTRSPRFAPLPPEYKRRLGVGAVIGVAAVLLLVLGYLVVTHVTRGDEPVAAAQDTAFRPPVAVPPGHEYLRARALASGDLLVTDWVHTRSVAFSATLRMPRLSGVRLRASNVRVVADGTSVDASTTGAARQYSFAGARRIQVSYRLRGAVFRSGEGRRVLVRTLGLPVVVQDLAGPRTEELTGGRVLSMACVTGWRSDAGAQPCGDPKRRDWIVHLRGRDRGQRVLAQVDLPAS